MELKRIIFSVSSLRGFTFNRTLWNWNAPTRPSPPITKTFNRTLWNWNFQTLARASLTIPFNRTLWNWNSLWRDQSSVILAFNRTLWNWNSFFRNGFYIQTMLLIVPYGIETNKLATGGDSGCRLLIVPYGIETSICFSDSSIPVSFNRTLWNWNCALFRIGFVARPFNRTLWNWNLIRDCLLY